MRKQLGMLGLGRKCGLEVLKRWGGKEKFFFFFFFFEMEGK